MSASYEEDDQSAAMKKPSANLIPLHQKVEVRRREEEGFIGPWQQGTVIAFCREGWEAKYDVKFDHIDKSDSLVGSIRVPLSVDDDDDDDSYDCIRPFPPELDCNELVLHYGLCVDVNCNEGWWEGVIFDHGYGSGERKRNVFFPDSGDEMLVPLDAMRVSQDWDRFTGEWNRRRMWMFLDLIGEYEQEHRFLPVSVQQVWDDLRSKEGFKKLGKWNSCSRTTWEELLLSTIEDNLKAVLNYLFQEISLPEGVIKLSEFVKSDWNPSTVVNCETALSSPKNDDSIKSLHCHENGDSVTAPASSFFIFDEAISRSSPEKFTITFASPPRIKSPSEKYDRTQAVDDSYVHIEPKHCPQAVVDWYTFSGYGRLRKREATKGENFHLLAKRARNHLAAMGWKFVYAYHHGKREMKHISPSGKSYYSLRRCCKICMEDSGIGIGKGVPSKPVDLHNVADITRDAKRDAKRGQDGSSVKLKTDTKVTDQLADLRPSKRVRNNNLVPKPPHKNTRTVLSWLLENNAVLSRAKVYYYRSALGDRSIAEGRITRDGIKCNCCKKIYSLGKFQEHHGGGKRVISSHRGPASNIFLKDGRSLLDCQVQVMHDAKMRLRSLRFGQQPGMMLQGRKQGENDCVCSVCRYGGDLILCDLCPSSYHQGCLNLTVVPDGDWFCPCCCCRICCQRGLQESGECVADEHMLNCGQCERKNHISCLRNKGIDGLEHHPKTNWFCSGNCESISRSLAALIGKPIPAGVENLTWTMLKLVESDSITFVSSCSSIELEIQAQSYSKLNIALQVMHECFDPLEEPHTKRDIIRDIIFSKRSELRRLDFRGFYTVILEKDDEVISVAAVRVFGEEVAEVPLIGTALQHRRRGMCRVLMNVIEKKLVELGVQRLVLPAVPSMLNKWTGSFGFSRMTKDERLLFVDCTFVEFQETIMCHKQLTAAGTPSEPEIQPVAQTPICVISDDDDIDLSTPISEVLQEDRAEEEVMEQC
ncbi:Increased DNA methylation 1 [Linum perenne]